MAGRLLIAMRSAMPKIMQLGGSRVQVGLAPVFRMLRALFFSKDVAVQNVLAFLAARADILAGIHPFGSALFIALIAQGGRKTAVAAGLSVIIGSATVLPWERTVPILIAILLPLVIFSPRRNHTAQRTRRTSRGGPPDGMAQTTRSALPSVWPIIFVSTVILAVSRILFVAGTTFSEFELFSAGVEAVLAGLLAYLLTPLVGFRWSRPIYAIDRRTWVAVVLLVAVASLGLYSVQFGWFHPAEIGMRWVIMSAAVIGSVGPAAAVGTLFGLLIGLAGGAPLGGPGLYAVAGLFAGLAAKRGKVGSAVGFIVGQLLISVLAADAKEISLGLIHSGLAILLFMLTPEGRLARLARLVPGAEADAMTRELREKRLKEALHHRLAQLGHLFDDLAVVFSPSAAHSDKKHADRDKLEQLIHGVWANQCFTCRGFDACWQKAAYKTYWDVVNVVAAADDGDGALTPEDLPPGLAQRCFQPEALIEAIHAALAQRDRQKGAGAGWGELVPRQLRGVARVIQQAAEEVHVDTGRAEEMEAFLRDEPTLSRAEGVELKVIRGGERPEIEATFHGPCDGDGKCSWILTAATERAIGCRYRGTAVCRTDSDGMCQVRLTPLPPFAVAVESISVHRNGARVSGDAHNCITMEDGKTALLLSDGMGSGSSAARESLAAVSLLGKMIQAGFAPSFAADTVNSALLMRSLGESFATIDLAIIDLFTGETEFLKGGSSPSFIKRKKGVEVVCSESLPIGILDDIDVASYVRLLGPDDVLIMVTDGVLDGPICADAAPSDEEEQGGGIKEEWMIGLLKGEATKDPGALAQTVVDKALERCQGDIPDDLTVLAARLVRRSVEEGEIPVYGRSVDTSRTPTR